MLNGFSLVLDEGVSDNFGLGLRNLFKTGVVSYTLMFDYC
jgi:hypothetical protein